MTRAASLLHSSLIRDIAMTDRTVAVVILNWNGGDEILDCLKSVYESKRVTVKVVVVDNGSVDGSVDLIRNQFPCIHWINNSNNLGFAKGSNQGMEWALENKIPYALLLNGDARLHPNAIEELLSAVVNENDTAVVCPRMYMGSTTDNPRRLWFVYGTVRLWSGLFSNPAFNRIDSSQWSTPMDMQYASGCCMLIPAQILQTVGLLDEAFFAYCEDIDFSLRVRAAGFRLRYVPTAYIWHGSLKGTNRGRSKKYRYLSTRNNLWVVRKHGSWLERLTCICILPSRSFFRIVRMMARQEWHAIASELQGIRDGVFSPIESPKSSAF